VPSYILRHCSTCNGVVAWEQDEIAFSQCLLCWKEQQGYALTKADVALKKLQGYFRQVSVLSYQPPPAKAKEAEPETKRATPPQTKPRFVLYDSLDDFEKGPKADDVDDDDAADDGIELVAKEKPAGSAREGYVGNLEAIVSGYRDEVAELQAKLEETQAKLTQETKQRKKAEKDAKQALSAFEAESRRNEAAQTHIRVLSESVTSLRAGQNVLREQIQVLTRENGRLRGTVAAYESASPFSRRSAGTVLTPELASKLIRLTHPDRHGNSQLSNEITAMLLDVKKGVKS
jgi:hypothetical protein